jgi:L-alanine-DL-glutamate epimerase-like enolase superfamily enzyme
LLLTSALKNKGESFYSVSPLLIVEQERLQYFMKNPVKPIDGFVTPPKVPGVGFDLDESKIESERC